MKKDYVKPEIHYESFVLSQHIAVCGWDMANSMDKNNCTAVGDTTLGGFDVNLFTNTNELCNLKEEDAHEIYCYEVGTGSAGVFNS